MIPLSWQILDHIPQFIATMDKVVIIWGMYSFIHQLNLQNATAVADRALGRLPELKNRIKLLHGCQQQGNLSVVKDIKDLYKNLFIDLQQLGIAEHYYVIKNRIEILLKDEMHCYALQSSEQLLSDGMQKQLEQTKEDLLDFIDQLEDELMTIYRMSHYNFMHSLSNSFLKVFWFSIVIYMISHKLYQQAISLFIVGVIFLLCLKLYKQYMHNKNI